MWFLVGVDDRLVLSAVLYSSMARQEPRCTLSYSHSGTTHGICPNTRHKSLLKNLAYYHKVMIVIITDVGC